MGIEIVQMFALPTGAEGKIVQSVSLCWGPLPGRRPSTCSTVSAQGCLDGPSDQQSDELPAYLSTCLPFFFLSLLFLSPFAAGAARLGVKACRRACVGMRTSVYSGGAKLQPLLFIDPLGCESPDRPAGVTRAQGLQGCQIWRISAKAYLTQYVPEQLEQ